MGDLTVIKPNILTQVEDQTISVFGLACVADLIPNKKELIIFFRNLVCDAGYL